MPKTRVAMVFAAICVAGSSLAAGAEQGGVYVAGQGFTLEQAADQALSERVENEPFWVVASGVEAARVTRGGGAAVLDRIRAHGGMVYVCEGDLRPEAKASLTQQLPQAVGLVRPPADERPVVMPPRDAALEDALPESDFQMRLILRACAALQ